MNLPTILFLALALFTSGSIQCHSWAGHYYQDPSSLAFPFPYVYGNGPVQELDTMAPAAQCSRAERVASLLLSKKSLELVSYREMQSLWAGYGSISAITARATTDAAAEQMDSLLGRRSDRTYPLVLKLIAPPPPSSSAKVVQDEGHLRKMLSYGVEQYFYTKIAPELADDVPVAKIVATAKAEDVKGLEVDEAELKGVTATVMADLRSEFPVPGGRRESLNQTQVSSSLGWLARFHGSSWEWLPTELDEFLSPPLQEAKIRSEQGEDKGGRSIWLNGGYTYLATRRKEYQSLVEDKSSEWSDALCKPVKGSSESIAEIVAAFLTPSGRPFETYIHGDVKSDNLFTTRSGDRVAFVDFQYVGLGLGVSDLAKLFTCSVPQDLLVSEDEGSLPEELAMESGERKLLEEYLNTLHEFADMADIEYPWDLFVRHWETALVDWCRFQASWGFWGNTEWLEARVRSILKDEGWREWLLAQRETGEI
ncbi:unnamed protein product [Clonostachys rhizophaga]|uniref:Aminoglycoside phosphotransferase domain-containing protein n=1 Tax=Clonostachys rhizophaga TaxID=160324 RepID=A0A9N9YV84_9HYPO|nr:unnamed protein product [Clonostachys rhizophaga]